MSGTCGECAFCVKDDGDPYCLMKDLYTTVHLDDECDEEMINGKMYFTKDE